MKAPGYTSTKMPKSRTTRGDAEVAPLVEKRRAAMNKIAARRERSFKRGMK